MKLPFPQLLVLVSLLPLAVSCANVAENAGAAEGAKVGSEIAKTAAAPATPVAGKSAAEGGKSKYGPEATVISRSHEYFRGHEAPDFWALIPYYVPQYTESACSLASITMVVNAARVGWPLTTDDKLATQPEVVKKAGNSALSRGTGTLGTGVKLDDLGPALVDSLHAYGIHNAKAEVVHVDASPESAAKLHAALVANEKSSHDFILANFDQAVFTGDAHVGHIAPVGAYDAEHRRVLIMDPDREWYEPYWVSEETFQRGMATTDTGAGKARGYVWVKIE